MHKPKKEKGKSKDPSVKMSPKCLETWLNETLQDAEHLDISGLVIKPENTVPLRRYGIHRERLVGEGGLSNETVDRIY